MKDKKVMAHIDLVQLQKDLDEHYQAGFKAGKESLQSENESLRAEVKRDDKEISNWVNINNTHIAKIAQLQSLLNNQQWTDELQDEYFKYVSTFLPRKYNLLKSPSDWLIERTQDTTK